MPIRYRCPTCQQLFSIATRMIGETVDCPKCGTATIVPERDAFDIDEPKADAPTLGPARQPGIVERDETLQPAEPPYEELSIAKPSSRVPANEPPEWNPPVDEPAHVRSNAPAGELHTEDQSTATTALAPEITRAFHIRSRVDTTLYTGLTPLAGLAFMVLIFFSIAATFSLQQTTEGADLPQGMGVTKLTPQALKTLAGRSIVVRVDERNLIYADDEPVADQHRLKQIFQDTLRNENRNDLLLIVADSAHHETVSEVIEAARKAGLQKIRLAVRPASP